MHKILIASTLALGLVACDKSESVDRDNTKVNERDRSAAALTPMDQGNSEEDRTITAEVRKGIVGDDGLSVTAKNVKIITRDGVVTLRGPVRSEAEKSSIERYAQNAAGVQSVDNQLEIAVD
jgi:hyperosmotically inducible periplasmic protein